MVGESLLKGLEPKPQLSQYIILISIESPSNYSEDKERKMKYHKIKQEEFQKMKTWVPKPIQIDHGENRIESKSEREIKKK